MAAPGAAAPAPAPAPAAGHQQQPPLPPEWVATWNYAATLSLAQLGHQASGKPLGELFSCAMEQYHSRPGSSLSAEQRAAALNSCAHLLRIASDGAREASTGRLGDQEITGLKHALLVLTKTMHIMRDMKCQVLTEQSARVQPVDDAAQVFIKSLAAACKAATAPLQALQAQRVLYPQRFTAALHMASILSRFAMITIDSTGSSKSYALEASAAALLAALPALLLAVFQLRPPPEVAAVCITDSSTAAHMRASMLSTGNTAAELARRLLRRCSTPAFAFAAAAQGCWAQLLQVALLLAAAHAAAWHAASGSISSGIAADPVAQLGSSSSGSGSSGGGMGTAGEQQQQQQARSPAGLAVPPLHARLLQQAPCLQECLLHTKEFADAARCNDAVLNVALGSMFALNCPQQLLQAAVPLLQVHIELAALQAGSISADKQASTMLTLEQLACRCEDLSDSLSASSSARTAAAALAAAATGASSGGAERPWLQPVQAAGLLQPVLHLLSGVVLHMLAAPGAAEHADSAMRTLTELCSTVAMSVEPKHLAAAISQQPLRSLAALELTIRRLAMALPQPSQPDAVLPLLQLATAVATACQAAAESQRLQEGLTASAEHSALTQNHFFSLLVSCLKCSRWAGNSVAECEAAVQLAAAVLGAACAVASTWEHNADSSSGSSSSSQPVLGCSREHGPVLMARCCSSIGFLTLQLMAAAGGSQRRGRQQQQCPSPFQALEMLMEAAHAAAGGANVHAVDAAASMAAVGVYWLVSSKLTPRLAKLAEVLERLEQQQHTASGSSGSSSSAATMLRLVTAVSSMSERMSGLTRAAGLVASERLGPRMVNGGVRKLELLEAYSHAFLPPPGSRSQRSSRSQQQVAAAVAPLAQLTLDAVVNRLTELQALSCATHAVLPLPSLACTNPSCDNLLGTSEMHLVWRKGVCGHCRGAARFCSTVCLHMHWSDHKDGEATVAQLLSDGVLDTTHY